MALVYERSIFFGERALEERRAEFFARKDHENKFALVMGEIRQRRIAIYCLSLPEEVHKLIIKVKNRGVLNELREKVEMCGDYLWYEKLAGGKSISERANLRSTFALSPLGWKNDHWMRYLIEHVEYINKWPVDFYDPTVDYDTDDESEEENEDEAGAPITGPYFEIVVEPSPSHY